jgi:two-component system response regulator FixJ
LEEQVRIVHVIDDDDAVRDSLRMLLESYGMKVNDYSSAKDFLARLCRNPTGCLLLDLHMPEMNGIELLDAMNERALALPAVIITGRGDAALKERALKAGAFALLDKPVEGAKLMAALDGALGQAAHQD